MATATSEIEDIRRQMARIRRELHEDVRGVVESAEAVTDWTHYIRDYPWASVGLALAVGFFVVPRRRSKSAKPAEVARAVVAQMQPGVQAVEAAAPEPPKKKGRGLIGAGLGLIAPIALRAAQNYATHFVGNWIAQQQEQMAAHLMAGAGMGPPPGGPGPGMGMGRPGGPSQTQGGMR